MSRLRTGKIDSHVLESLLSHYTREGHRVVIGSGIGEDATVIDMGRRYLVAKTDPITHATNEIGHYAVNVNANDIAAMGGTPMWFLATILMPEGGTSGQLETIFSQIAASCDALGVAYCGGHTEVTTGVTNPVVVGQMLGEVEKDHLKPSSGGREGDEVLITKRAAIEATAIMALEKGAELRARVSDSMIARARGYLRDPGISVVKEAGIVCRIKDVHALHDPTEGGIATGVFEMAAASNLGVRIHRERIPVSEETRALCECFGVDPLGTFASGSLLIAASPGSVREIIAALGRHGVPAVSIGTLTRPEKGMVLESDGNAGPLPVYYQDELSRIFG